MRVFISYSRRDSSRLAEELVTALELLGFEGVLDRQDIAAAEDWEARLANLIQGADTVIFVLSPEAVKSPRCAWEVDKAVELSKRLIPIVGTAVRDEDVPLPLRRLNYVFFSGDASFSRALGQVAHALRADLDWIHEHTRLDGAARRWHERGRLEALLLRDGELVAAHAWKSARSADAPEMTDRQLTFIAASSDGQTTRLEQERQQRDTFANAQSARADALAAQAVALADRERAVHTLQRRTVLAGIGAGVFSIGIGGVSYWAWRAERKFRDEHERAEQAHAASLAAAIQREAARVDIEGQLVAYAASPGEFAMDSVEGEANSPYTKRLLEELADPNTSVQAALAQASRKVLVFTKSSQRPYLASDLNGDMYLRQQPTSRRCKAIVVAVERAGKTTFANVARDGDAWASFLKSCGFQVTHLVNPTHQQLVDALSLVPFGVAPTPDGPAKPEANTCFLFFFSGGGSQIDRDLLLMASDTVTSRELIDPAKALDVATLSSQIRTMAAASLIVLDTAFPHVGTR
ncbi:MAG: TIR domain-containing protein [Vicinamibacterales bacterium]